MSPASSLTGLSSASSFSTFHRGAWCTPPRLFLEDQVPIHHLSISRDFNGCKSAYRTGSILNFWPLFYCLCILWILGSEMVKNLLLILGLSCFRLKLHDFGSLESLIGFVCSTFLQFLHAFVLQLFGCNLHWSAFLPPLFSYIFLKRMLWLFLMKASFHITFCILTFCFTTLSFVPVSLSFTELINFALVACIFDFINIAMRVIFFIATAISLFLPVWCCSSRDWIRQFLGKKDSGRGANQEKEPSSSKNQPMDIGPIKCWRGFEGCSRGKKKIQNPAACDETGSAFWTRRE